MVTTVKVKEMRSLVKGLKGEGKVTNQNVEFVLDAKKYFASDVKAGTDTMTIEVTRENYYPLSIDQLENSLKLANGELEVQVLQGKTEKTVTESFLTDSSLELVLG